MSRIAAIAASGLLALLAVLAGCATPPEAPPAEWKDTSQVPAAPSRPVVETFSIPIPTNRVTVVASNPPPVVATNVPLPVAGTQPAPTNRPPPPPVVVHSFTSLKRWALEQQLEPPRLVSRSPLVTYELGSSQGQLFLAIGSREVAWNGVTVRLGYAPEIIDGEVYVYDLDLQKTLSPFLCQRGPVFGTNRVIVIDPGHGGINGGTVSVGDRRPEKEFTLDWARRLQPLLEQEGWRVFLTRTNDMDVALSNRVQVAENHHADLFVSLHFNSVAPDQKPLGLATFCLTPVGLPSSVVRGEYPDLVFQGFPNNSFDTQNVLLAEQLQRSLLRTTGLEDRGVNRARFIGVLRGQHRPSVLIEAGFLSNPHEAKRIESADFRQKLAIAVAAALR